MARLAVLRHIQALDPVGDHQRIVFLSTCYDFPFDTTRALELALFRTFCVPSISRLLERTGEFLRRSQKRYDDTDLIVSELMEWGYASDRGKRALRRMNQLHGRFAIANDDYLYVLSTFVFEPIRWNARFGWRRMCEQERRAQFYFWREVGRRMDLRDLPADMEAFERFNREYEKTRYRYAESNHRIGEATLALFCGWFPRLLAPFVRQAMLAMMDDPVREAFGFERPSPVVRGLVLAGMRLRARVLRWLPPRRRPRLRTRRRSHTYPDGYVIEQLGPSDAA
jgi:hypothetical protein